MALIYSKCISAMGAGAVASVIQAALSAVGEPIEPRVGEENGSHGCRQGCQPSPDVELLQDHSHDELPEVSILRGYHSVLPLPANSSSHPWHRHRLRVQHHYPTGHQLPYRKSMELPVEWGNIYEAYTPTVIRDIAYAI